MHYYLMIFQNDISRFHNHKNNNTIVFKDLSTFVIE